MKPDQLVKRSKWLSKHLRHEPGRIGLELEEGGWVSVERLLQAAAEFHVALSRAELEEVVAGNDKKRFSFNETGEKIRANQGHSVEVDLQLKPRTPPEMLLHGTARHLREVILREGLHKGARHHVHLSMDVTTATKVGARHGQPLVLTVLAGKMHREGHLFFQSENGVWLTDHVPATYLVVNS